MKKMSMFAVSAAALLALTGCVTPGADTDVADAGTAQEATTQSSQTTAETEASAESETRAPRRACRRVEVPGRRVAQRICD